MAGKGLGCLYNALGLIIGPEGQLASQNALQVNVAHAKGIQVARSVSILTNVSWQVPKPNITAN